jgi:hypothetical protein
MVMVLVSGGKEDVEEALPLMLVVWWCGGV